MVYCGKPSRGCQMCRTRRIKCDETKPTCNQCTKSRRQCPGYKDEFDLVFRNETKATERRAKKATKKAAAAAAATATTTTAQRVMGSAGQEPISPASSSVGGGDELSPTFKDMIKSPFELAVIPAIQIPPETRATCHFVSNFVLIPRQGGTRGFMDYLVPLMKSESANSHLQHAFNACALASLGNRTNAGGGGGSTIDFAAKAYNEYTKALSATNAALRDPEASRSDGLLAAVLLLGMFENITAKQMGDFAWGSHVEGAIQIVKARGRKQLRTKIGLMLFIAVRTQLIIHTLTSGKAPIMGVEWWMGDAVKDEMAASCQRLNLRTSELRAEVTRVMTTVARTPENVELMQCLMRRAQELDADSVEWMRRLPEHWQYKTLCWEDHVPNGDYSRAEVFPGRVDVYNDFWIASVWNMARTNRLILASITVRCAAWVCSPVDYRTTPEYATAARVCMDTITDILACVPYHLGWHVKRKHLFQNDELSGFACGDDSDTKGLAGYFLTWPLACVMGQDYATDAQRQWVQGRLKFIGDELGIKYAHILSQLQVRIPSMLIRRDGLMAQPYPMAHNFEKLLSARMAPPTAGYAMNPLQQREAMQKEDFEKRRSELLNKATGTATGSTGESVKLVAQKWLTV
ncbi:hypothetical protein QBC46DRAFT_461206 [Diplogelasinospora grovesii]|uniref:Zn(2)-C6 fungal-type domain-containing protein n=1 Tax=Diplogelasinospora grovesii TaxID=303347 RepID=A0AAN6N167_9PEZI|nr:hypothetical protein QBC46DRAFT_461206 [Diplogelasinospora grovesii]